MNFTLNLSHTIPCISWPFYILTKIKNNSPMTWHPYFPYYFFLLWSICFHFPLIWMKSVLSSFYSSSSSFFFFKGIWSWEFVTFSPFQSLVSDKDQASEVFSAYPFNLNNTFFFIFSFSVATKFCEFFLLNFDYFHWGQKRFCNLFILYYFPAETLKKISIC